MFLVLLASLELASSAHAAPPPLPGQESAAERYFYSGPGGVQREMSTGEILAAVRANPDGTHLVWQEGWPEWKPWREVPALAKANAPIRESFSYAGPGGTVETLTAAEIAARIAAAPGASHLAWREGLPEWKNAAELPAIAAHLPPTPPPVAAPPPLPARPPALPSAPSARAPAPPIAPALPPPALAPQGPAPHGSPPAPHGSAPAPHGPPPAPHGPPQAAPLPPPFAAPPAPFIPEVPVAPPAPGRPPLVKVGAQVRLNLQAENLERYGDPAFDDAQPAAAFVVARLRPRIDVSLNEHFRGFAAIEFHQDDSVDGYEIGNTSLSIPRFDGGWLVQGREVYAEAKAGKSIEHRVRFGFQKPAFGTRDRFDRYGAYYLGGTDAYKDLYRRAGLIDGQDAGLGYRVSGGAKWAADLQILNGSGLNSLDENTSKDVVARASATPIKWVTVEASALRGVRGEQADQKLVEIAGDVEFRGPRQRLLAEGVFGRTEEGGKREFSGWSATGAWDFPLPRATILDRVSLVGRYMGFDPVGGKDYPDAWWVGDFGAMLYWDANEGQTLLTGLTWESYIPENSDEPLEHSLVAQVALDF